MTRHYLTDKDLEVLNSGDRDEIFRHVNNLRGELVELQETVADAVQIPDPATRACELRKAVATDKEPVK